MNLSRLLCSMCTCMLHYVFATCCFMAILAANGAVTVNVELAQPFYKPNDKVVISCTYSRGSEFLLYVQWLNGSTIVANYDATVSTLTYPASPNYDTPAYTMSIDNIDSGSTFTISKATFTDNGNYICGVEAFIPGSDSVLADDVEELVIHVKYSTSVLDVGEPGFVMGGELDVTAGVQTTITLTVPDIFPAATFAWKLGTRVLSETTQNETDLEGLIISTSTVTFTPVILDTGEQVTCAFTVGNEAPVELGIAQLAVTVPCKGLSVGAIVGIVCGCVAFVGGGIAAYIIGALKKGSAVKPAKVDSPREPESAQQNGTNDKNTSDKKNDNGETAS